MKKPMRAAVLPIAALLTALADAPPVHTPQTTPNRQAGSAGETATLHLKFEGLRAPKGTVRICLWQSGQGFPDCKSSDRVRRLQASARGDAVALDVDVPPGAYALSVIHDENDNRKLDKSFIGLPTEGVAFSNNASAPFGPPKFGQVRFEVSGDTTQRLKMRYYL